MTTGAPTGGVPETCQQQLDESKALEEDIDANAPTIEAILANGLALSARQPNSAIGAKMKTMEQKWKVIQERRHERRQRLVEALANAEEFERMMAELEEWLAKAEHFLNTAPTPSRLLQPLADQCSEHEAFLNEGRVEEETRNEQLLLRSLNAAISTPTAIRKALSCSTRASSKTPFQSRTDWRRRSIALTRCSLRFSLFRAP